MARVRQPDLPVDGELELRPWSGADVTAVLEAFSDPDIQHWHFRRSDSESEARVWIAECASRWSAETSATWAITAIEHDEVVGRVCLYTDLAHGHGEITYWVLPRARRRHVATRACLAVTRWGHDLGLHRIRLQHSTSNPLSRGVALRAGYTEEGVQRGAALHADGWHDMRLYSHLSTDAAEPPSG